MAIIPCLFNDLALQCLIALPSTCHRRAKKVSPLWRIAMESDRFYLLRRAKFPSASPSIFVVRKLPEDRVECIDFDLEDLRIHHTLFRCDLPSAQVLFPRGSFCCSAFGNVIFGGGAEEGSPKDGNAAVRVHRFDILSRRWSSASPMKSSHPHCYACLIGSRTFVVDVNGEAEVYDHQTDRWDKVQGLPEGVECHACFSLHGKLYAKGTDNHGGDGLAVVYAMDPSKLRWEEDTGMADRLRDVAVVGKIVARPDGSLFAVETWNNHLVMKLRRPGDQWIEMFKRSFSGSMHDLFLFCKGKKVVLVLPDRTGNDCRCESFPFFQGFFCLHIPSCELPHATLIEGC